MQRQAERVLMMVFSWCFDAFGVFVRSQEKQRAKTWKSGYLGFLLILACIKTSCVSDCVLLQKEAGNANLDVLTWVSPCGIDKCQL